MNIETGTQVRFKKDGLAGLVHKVFENFNAITPDFILDKEVWLEVNRYYKSNELLKLLNNKWIAIDCFDGGQSIHPINEIELI